jgi:hypothetical protein
MRVAKNSDPRWLDADGAADYLSLRLDADIRRRAAIDGIS